MEQFKEHRNIQENILNTLCLAIGIIAIPALLFSIYRIFDTGWLSQFYTDILATLFAITLAIFRKRVPYNLKTALIISLSFALAIASTINLALSGFLCEYLMLAVLSGAIFWERKQALVIFIISAVIILSMGTLACFGIIANEIDLNTYSSTPSSWLGAFSDFSLIAALSILITGKIGHELSAKTAELKKALEEIKQLQGILPICSRCKKIRDDNGYWNQVETYIEKHTDALFSHGICKPCADELYGDKEWYNKSDPEQPMDQK